jgi:hypothetical protein
MTLTFNDKNIFDCSTEELREAENMLKRAWSLLEQKQTAQFRVGDKVKFFSRKGFEVTGTISKINQKTVSLKTDYGSNWRVSSSLLERV